MDGPSPLGSNGRPYVIDEFSVTGRPASPEAFEEVETTSEPLEIVASNDAGTHTDALPLNLQIISFDS